MWHLFVLVIATLLSDSTEKTLEHKSPALGGQLTREASWWWNGKGNPSGPFAKPQNGMAGRRLDPSNQCILGKTWSKTKQMCVSGIGMAKATKNSRRSSVNGLKCAPGRRWSQRQRKCIKKKSKGKGADLRKGKSRIGGLTSRSRPRARYTGTPDPSWHNLVGRRK